MTNQTQPTLGLNDGATMPQFGLGVFQTPPDATERVVGWRSKTTIAWSIRRRCIETRRASARPARPDRLFVTTKLGNSDHGFDEALRAFDESIRKLRRDTLDLY